ncbi:MAG: hypothetical protein EOO25_12195 [Comamonadaceae bacterium]|nr:MAG: hypothetical protein EOO25_12195 [Comamonadaceae bacterium]
MPSSLRLLRHTVALLLMAVALLGPATTMAITYTYAGPAVPIPDGPGAEVPGATVAATLNVAGFAGPLGAVTLVIGGSACNAVAGSATVGVDHTFVGDLVLTLRSPAGTSVTVVNRLSAGGGGNSGNNLCQVVLTDATPNPSVQTLLAASAPFTGTWQPANALSAFAGENPNGNWELQATDFFVGDVGNIRAFSLDIVPAQADLQVTQVASVPGNVTAGQTISFTATMLNQGPNTAAGASLTVALLPGLTLVSAVSSAGTLVTSTSTAIAAVPALASGATLTLTVQALVTTATGTVTSVATGTSSVADPVPGDNTASISRNAVAAPVAVVPAVAVPLFSPAALAALVGMLALLGLREQRRRAGPASGLEYPPQRRQ